MSCEITGSSGESSRLRLELLCFTLELLSAEAELAGVTETELAGDTDAELLETAIAELDTPCASELELPPFSKLELEAETITTSILPGKSSASKGATAPKAKAKPTTQDSRFIYRNIYFVLSKRNPAQTRKFEPNHTKL